MFVQLKVSQKVPKDVLGEKLEWIAAVLLSKYSVALSGSHPAPETRNATVFVDALLGVCIVRTHKSIQLTR